VHLSFFMHLRLRLHPTLSLSLSLFPIARIPRSLVRSVSRTGNRPLLISRDLIARLRDNAKRVTCAPCSIIIMHPFVCDAGSGDHPECISRNLEQSIRNVNATVRRKVAAKPTSRETCTSYIRIAPSPNALRVRDKLFFLLFRRPFFWILNLFP